MIVERLDTERIAGQQHALPAFIPHNERIHATQLVHHLYALLGVEVQQGFGIGVRSEADAFRFQPGADLGVVIDLAVEHDAAPAIVGDHGLRAAFAEVDDGEPAVCQPYSTIGRDPQARCIRTAGLHTVADKQQLLLVDPVRACISECPCDATHNQFLCRVAHASRFSISTTAGSSTPPTPRNCPYLVRPPGEVPEAAVAALVREQHVAMPFIRAWACASASFAYCCLEVHER